MAKIENLDFIKEILKIQQKVVKNPQNVRLSVLKIRWNARSRICDH